ncbi:MAG: hypothetical protein PSV46_23685 [Reyranella sp.]|nr:hypothetical protein [Reyranella sp.]
MPRWLPRLVLPGVVAALLLPVLLLPIVLLPGPSHAQRTPEQLAARCAELGAIFDRYGTRRSEGSGGPDMTRLGATIDCQKGRYEQGIKALEGLLQRNKIPYPPAA